MKKDCIVPYVLVSCSLCILSVLEICALSALGLSRNLAARALTASSFFDLLADLMEESISVVTHMLSRKCLYTEMVVVVYIEVELGCPLNVAARWLEGWCTSWHS